jgi:2-polyprenyl-6-hydroxyphenyl methylase/3-demethylubiquinone-9 3-methyltransferase
MPAPRAFAPRAFAPGAQAAPDHAGIPHSAPGANVAQANVAQAEIARFAALAREWWDPAGPMAMLHRMNPARLSWAIARAAARGLTPPGPVLDVGCGAGLAAEGLARRGFAVLGLDASAELIAVARAHAGATWPHLSYRAATIEELAAEGARFPLITAYEVIEHVPDPASFLATLAELLSPGGLLVLSTLNRTLASLVLAKWMGEYVLGWVPRGAHEWRRFLRPEELEGLGGRAGLVLDDLAGLSFDPLRRRFTLSRDLRINYLIAFHRPF